MREAKTALITRATGDWMNNPISIVLPVGEFDSSLVQREFESIVGVFQRLGVDLVIADSISDEVGARLSIQEFSKKNPDFLLIIPMRGLSAQAIETVSRECRVPCLIWPVPGRFALPSSTLAVGALRESGVPVEFLYAPPDHPMSVERARRIIRAAMTYTRIRKSRIGVVGSLFSNLVSCRYDPQIINSRLGTTILPISYSDLHAAMQFTARRHQEIELSLQALALKYNIGVSDRDILRAGIQLHLAMKQIAQEHNLHGFATECWTGLPREFGMNPCLGFIEDEYVLACEGDVMLCLTLLIIRYLTGKSAYVGDLYDLDLDGDLTLIHCGAPASLASNETEIVLARSQVALERGFETLTCRPRLEPGGVTLIRFYGTDCNHMHLASADLLSSEQSPSLTVKLKLNGDRWEFLEQCGGNHYCVVAGDIRGELKLLGKWLGISIHDTTSQE